MNKLTCDNCFQIFSSMSALNNHKNKKIKCIKVNIDANGNPIKISDFQCIYCYKILSSKRNLESHYGSCKKYKITLFPPSSQSTQPTQPTQHNQSTQPIQHNQSTQPIQHNQSTQPIAPLSDELATAISKQLFDMLSKGNIISPITTNYINNGNILNNNISISCPFYNLTPSDSFKTIPDNFINYGNIDTYVFPIESYEDDNDRKIKYKDTNIINLPTPNIKSVISRILDNNFLDKPIIDRNIWCHNDKLFIYIDKWVVDQGCRIFNTEIITKIIKQIKTALQERIKHINKIVNNDQLILELDITKFDNYISGILSYRQAHLQQAINNYTKENSNIKLTEDVIKRIADYLLKEKKRVDPEYYSKNFRLEERCNYYKKIIDIFNNKLLDESDILNQFKRGAQYNHNYDYDIKEYLITENKIINDYLINC